MTNTVIEAVLVILADVERRIREHGVDHPGLNGFEMFNAVSGEQEAM
jgi:hypothetical protein